MRRVVACWLALALLAGCSAEQPPPDATNAAMSRMKTLATLYGRCVSQNGGRLPADEEAFRAYIRTEGKGVLARESVSSVDDLFVSLRDGQPLVISYGKQMPSREFTPELVVAHEQTGIQGKRLAAFPNGAVLEIDESTFDQLQAAKPVNE